MSELIIITRVTDKGLLPGHKSKEIKQYLELLRGKPIEIRMRKVSSKRSLQQNSYLHLIIGIITEAFNELGNDYKPSTIKTLLKAKFLTREVYNKDTGELLGEEILETHELSVSDMALFITQVIDWADGFGIKVPAPLTQTEIFN